MATAVRRPPGSGVGRLGAARRAQTSGIAAQITVPALIAAQPGDAESRRLYNAIPSPKVLAEFDPDAGEWGHCDGVALSRYDKVVYDWLDGILAS